MAHIARHFGLQSVKATGEDVKRGWTRVSSRLVGATKENVTWAVRQKVD